MPYISLIEHLAIEFIRGLRKSDIIRWMKNLKRNLNILILSLFNVKNSEIDNAASIKIFTFLF